MLTAALAAAGLLASCVQMDEKQDAAVGYLAFPELEVDVTVEGLMETRAVSLPDVPLATDFDIVVTDVNGKTYDLEPGTELPLPVGSYTISASYGSNSFGTPYFLGSASGEISAVQVSRPELSVSLQNSLVMVSIGSDLAEHFFPNTDVTLTPSAGSVETVALDEWIYVPSGVTLTASIGGASSTGSETSFSYSFPRGVSNPAEVVPTAAKTAYNLVCGKGSSWPVITVSSDKVGVYGKRLYIDSNAASVQNVSAENLGCLEYEVSTSGDFSSKMALQSADGCFYVDGTDLNATYYVRAVIGNLESSPIAVTDGFKAATVNTAHFNDDSGSLAGTNARINYGFTGYVKTLVDDGRITVTSADVKRGNIVVRSIPKKEDLMEVENNWPYLPQSADGSAYTLDVTLSLDGASTSRGASKSGVDVDPPTFTVSLTGSYCSYDKYTSEGATAANNCAAEKIYKAKASWGISSDIMEGSNYSFISKTLTFTIDGSPSSAQNININAKTSYTQEEITGVEWGAKALKARVTFDGASMESSAKTHHITGLPYSSFITNEGEHHWTIDQDNSGTFKWGTSGNPEFTMVTSKTGGSYLKVGSPEFVIPSSVNITVNVSAHGNKVALTTYTIDCRVYANGATNDFAAKYNSGNYLNYSSDLSLSGAPAKVQIESRKRTSLNKLFINNVQVLYRDK